MFQFTLNVSIPAGLMGKNKEWGVRGAVGGWAYTRSGGRIGEEIMGEWGWE